METQSLDDFYLFRVDVADTVRDLAILRLDSGMLPEHGLPARIKVGDFPEVGDRTFVIGHPLYQFFNLSIGYISAPEFTTHSRVSYLRSSTQVFFGNSGGPLFDDRGRLVGIVSSIRGQQAYLGQYVSFEEIMEFLIDTGYLS
jgi:serine protease Do